MKKCKIDFSLNTIVSKEIALDDDYLKKLDNTLCFLTNKYREMIKALLENSDLSKVEDINIDILSINVDESNENVNFKENRL